MHWLQLPRPRASDSNLRSLTLLCVRATPQTVLHWHFSHKHQVSYLNSNALVTSLESIEPLLACTRHTKLYPVIWATEQVGVSFRASIPHQPKLNRLSMTNQVRQSVPFSANHLTLRCLSWAQPVSTLWRSLTETESVSTASGSKPISRKNSTMRHRSTCSWTRSKSSFLMSAVVWQATMRVPDTRRVTASAYNVSLT